MELKQIKELMAAMEKAGVRKVRLKEKGGFEVEIEREKEHSEGSSSVHPASYAHVYHPPMPTHREHPHPHFPSEPKQESPEAVAELKGGEYVTSPMVGTFYASPSPDDPLFIKVGDRVEEDTVVCIVEAMKVMNEVKAGIKGKVVEILVENGHPVEFGTKLFRVE